MKEKICFLARISLILIMLVSSHDTTKCQELVQSKTIELPQGCKLVLDTTINLTDTISERIINGISAILPHVQELIPLDSVTIYLGINSQYVLPVWGVGGRTIQDDNGERIEFYYDPKHPDFKVEYVLRSLVHEFHHACRIRMPQFQVSLLEGMISEGLADHFMIEVMHCEITPFSSSLTEEQIRNNMLRVKPFIRTKFKTWTQEYNDKYFVPWMFGRTGDDPIPPWTGYSIGWKIVENYLKAHPEARASSLVFTSPEIIVSSTSELMDDHNGKK